MQFAEILPHLKKNTHIHYSQTKMHNIQHYEDVFYIVQKSIAIAKCVE